MVGLCSFEAKQFIGGCCSESVLNTESLGQRCWTCYYSLTDCSDSRERLPSFDREKNSDFTLAFCDKESWDVTCHVFAQPLLPLLRV